MPKVSILLWSHGQSGPVDEWIRSLSSQRLQDYEVIVVGDTSPNRPLVTALQGGEAIRAAQGEYIWAADPSTSVQPAFLETLVGLLDRLPNVGLAYSNSTIVYDETSPHADMASSLVDLHPTRWHEDFINSGPDECRRYLVLRNTIPYVSAVVFRRAALEAAGGPRPTPWPCRSWSLWIRLLLQLDLAYVAAPLHHVLAAGPAAHGLSEMGEIDFTEKMGIVQLVATRAGLSPDQAHRVARSCIEDFRRLSQRSSRPVLLGTSTFLEQAKTVSSELFFGLLAVAQERADRAGAPVHGGAQASFQAGTTRAMTTPASSPPSALVLIPGVVNYFYNLHGRRIAETLGELGFQVEVGTLTCHPAGNYDFCLLSAPTEVLHSAGNEDLGWHLLRQLRDRCKILVSSSLEAAGTPWLDRIYDCCQRIGVDTLLDFGFHDQRQQLAPEVRASYTFILSGLTTSEMRLLEEDSPADATRTIPWAFVGHQSRGRFALIGHLLRAVDPRGFVYIPPLTTPCTEKRSHHLNQAQFEAVLRRTRYQIWCSHHDFFYMESERFRMSLLTGGIPLKVLLAPPPREMSLPFDYLMVEEAAVGPLVSSFPFETLRRRFQQDFLQLKSLKEGLAEYLMASRILPAQKVAHRDPRPASSRKPSHAA